MFPLGSLVGVIVTELVVERGNLEGGFVGEVRKRVMAFGQNPIG